MTYRILSLADSDQKTYRCSEWMEKMHKDLPELLRALSFLENEPVAR